MVLRNSLVRRQCRRLVLSVLFAASAALVAPARLALAQAPAPAGGDFNSSGSGDFGPGRIDLKPPGPREFILDQAALITDADKQKIRQLADKLLTDKAAPIIVVTIDSMAKHGGAGMRIETFARFLFDQWQIGPAKLGQAPWNYGILLLVSRDDRQARIELGAGWKRDKDALALQIMDGQIIPHFKQGDFSGGILAGVEALDKMARGLQLPRAAASPPTTREWIVTAVLAGLAVFTIVSLIRRGSSGWAWLFWAGIFSVVGMILYQMATSRSSGGGGSFSGGSFGGGFSGGGGASGSW